MTTGWFVFISAMVQLPVSMYNGAVMVNTLDNQNMTIIAADKPQDGDEADVPQSTETVEIS